MKDLQKRLSELPAGLEPLYQRMVENIKPRYQEQAAQLFLIVDAAAYHLTSLALSFVDEDPKAVLSFQQGVFSGEEIERRHILVSKRLKSRCVGLIEISVPRDDSLYKSISSANWEAYRVQFLHLTVKEFLTTHKMQNWLATRPSTNTPNLHVQILTCCIRQLQVTNCMEFGHWRPERKELKKNFDQIELIYSFQRASGIIRMIFFHALQAEKVLHRSQLNYLEALDRLMQAVVVSRLPRILERDGSEKKLRPLHWTTLRYDGWLEPVQWQSDSVAYLVTIGMARAVTEKIQAGYQPSSKPGRPLLHYAIGNSHIVYDYAIDPNNERDKVDPNIVEGLLEKGCDPNQILKLGEQAEMEYEYGETVWDDILLHIWRRFCSPSPTTELAREYYGQLLEQETAMNDLRLRWLKTFRLLVEYGANVKTPPLTIYSQSLSGRVGFKMSALSIFDDSFAAFDHPLVQSTRELLISKGGTVLKERVSDKDWRFPSGAKKGATSRLACCCSPS
jgi:hypothetical protein